MIESSKKVNQLPQIFTISLYWEHTRSLFWMHHNRHLVLFSHNPHIHCAIYRILGLSCRLMRLRSMATDSHCSFWYPHLFAYLSNKILRNKFFCLGKLHSCLAVWSMRLSMTLYFLGWSLSWKTLTPKYFSFSSFSSPLRAWNFL